jgi:hypothetical protein
MKDRVLLITGCSNAAGSEIDGSQDSAYNRQHSFGNVLAEKLGRRAVNIALSGSSNQGMARTVLEWYSKCYHDNMDLMVLVAWSESSRMEIPNARPTHYEEWNPASDFLSEASRDFFRVNFGYKGTFKEEQEMIERCHNFMVDPFNQIYLETISASTVLQMQYFFKLNKIDYLMCNTMHMFTKNKHIQVYLDLIDNTRYLNATDNNQSFYWKYRNLGFTNSKAQYWHHDEQPHLMFADELYSFHLNNSSI